MYVAWIYVKIRMVQIFALFADGLATAKIRTAKVYNVHTLCGLNTEKA